MTTNEWNDPLNGADDGWDSMAARNLRARLATVEAERQRLEADLATQKCREEDMVNTLRQERAGYQNRVEQLEAERDLERAALAGAMATAKSLAEERDKAVERSNFFEAGEARAVEALWSVRGTIDDVMNHCGPQIQEDLRNAMDAIEGATYAEGRQPALDWLAQQRREAAAEESWRCFQCGFCTTEYEKAEAHFGDRDEEMALCQWWKDSTDTERVQALQDAIEEQNAAQAGEARALEALDVFARAYRVSMLPFAPGIDEADGAHHWMPHGWPSVADFKRANSVLSDSSALDWLSQQRREAAAEVVNALADGCERAKRPILAQELRGHAAALRAGEVGNG